MSLTTRPCRSARLGTIRPVAIAAYLVGLLACDPYVTVTGVVRESSGGPLADVTVTLRTVGREPDIARTVSDGKFNVGMVGADPRKTSISFTKTGFRGIEETVGEEERRMMEVTLDPE